MMLTTTALAGLGIVEIFDKLMWPIVVEGGKLLFEVALVGGVYMIMRHQVGDGIKKIKTTTIGYCLLRFVHTYIELIDNLMDGL